MKVPLCHVLPNGQLSNEGVNCLADRATWKDHRYNCKHCSFKFELPALLEHLEKEIPDVTQKTIECPQCFEEFAFINSYINHVIVKHNEDIAFNCIGCSLFFHNIPSLINHYKDQHFNLYTDKIFPCLICRSYSILSFQLKKHRLKHFRKNKIKKSELDDLYKNVISNTRKLRQRDH